MVLAVLRDEQRILPAAVRLGGEYCYDGICLGVPVVIGRGGMLKVVELELTPAEHSALDQSAAAVREGVKALD